MNSQLDTLVELVPTIAPTSLVQKLKDKLAWLIDYQQDIRRWHQMVQMTRTVETQLKLFGLSQQSLTIFAQQHFTIEVNSPEYFSEQIWDYLATESSQIPEGLTLLATSDLIESLFGKFQQFSSRSPLKQMGLMLLTIALSTLNLTATVVKQALETIRFVDVQTWSAQVFGQSLLSKRTALFSAAPDDTETA